MNDQAWELAHVIARNETRATTIVAALAESQPVSLSSLPLSAYTAEIRRDWRDSGKDTDPAELTDDLAVIFDRLGTAVRSRRSRVATGTGETTRRARLRCGSSARWAISTPRAEASGLSFLWVTRAPSPRRVSGGLGARSHEPDAA